jgi:hypothetical protein
VNQGLFSVAGLGLACGFALGLTPVSHATNIFDVLSGNRQCVLDAQDSNDLGPRMSSGPYVGQCMDTSAKRAIKIESEDPSAMVFSNFYHAGQFWQARIEKSAIASVIFQIEKFPAPLNVTAAHTQLRFVLAEGKKVQLTSQSGPAKTDAVDSFVASYEYIAPKGIPFDVVKGEFNNFNIVGRVISYTTRLNEQVVLNRDPVTEYTLTLTAAQASAVALSALRESDRIAYDHAYNTLDFNCTTEAFAVLDQSIDYGHWVPKFVVGIPNVMDPVTLSSLLALRIRGLLGAHSPSQTINPR